MTQDKVKLLIAWAVDAIDLTPAPWTLWQRSPDVVGGMGRRRNLNLAPRP